MDGVADPPIPFAVFDGLVKPLPRLGGFVYVGVDARPERDRAVVVASDGVGVEVVEGRTGLDWVDGFLRRLLAKNADVMSVSVARGGPLEGLGEELELEGVVVSWFNLGRARKAHGAFYDGCINEELRISDSKVGVLRMAVAGAEQKPSGGSWVWARQDKVGGDISCLVAASMCYYSALEDGAGLEFEKLLEGARELSSGGGGVVGVGGGGVGVGGVGVGGGGVGSLGWNDPNEGWGL